MELSLLFKMAAVGIVVAVLNKLLQRAEKDEYTILTTVAGLIAVVLMLLPKLGELRDALGSAFTF